MLEEQHENFVAAVRKRELLVATTTMKMRGSEKKSELEHVRHFLHKTCNLGRFWKFHFVVVTVVNNGKGIINI